MHARIHNCSVTYGVTDPSVILEVVPKSVVYGQLYVIR